MHVKHDIHIRLDRIVQVNPPSHHTLNEEDLVCFLAMTDVKEGGGVERFQERSYKDVKSGYTSFTEGDVLVAKITPCFENLKGAYIKNMRSEVGFGSTEFHVVRPLNDTDSRFVYYITMSSEFRRKGMGEMTGSAGQKRVQSSFLRSYPIPMFPVEEQVYIANIISAWDHAIEQTERLIAAKRRRKQGLMQQLLTGKRRFKEFVKSESVRETKYGTVPTDWEYLKVADFASEVSERNTERADLPVLSCSKYDGLVESLKYFGKRVFSEDTTNYRVVRRNQFAYPCNHVEEGSIGVLDFLDGGIVSPIYAVFQTDDRIHVPFLYALFKTDLYRHIFEVSTSASVDRRGSLRWSEFAKIHIALPAMEEQKKIAACLNSNDKEIEVLCRKLDTLKEQKKGLMQQLLTGKIRVPINYKGGRMRNE